MWRRLAEIAGQYLQKGSRVYIEGRLQTRDWTGQDGNKRYTTEIIADNMIMLDRPSSQERPSAPSAGYAQPSGPESEPTISPDEPVTSGGLEDDNPSEEDIKVEDIPF